MLVFLNLFGKLSGGQAPCLIQHVITYSLGAMTVLCICRGTLHMINVIFTSISTVLININNYHMGEELSAASTA